MRLSSVTSCFDAVWWCTTIERPICFGNFTRALDAQWMMSCAMLKTRLSSAMFLQGSEEFVSSLLPSQLMIQRNNQHILWGTILLTDSWLISFTSRGLMEIPTHFFISALIMWQLWKSDLCALHHLMTLRLLCSAALKDVSPRLRWWRFVQISDLNKLLQTFFCQMADGKRF